MSVSDIINANDSGGTAQSQPETTGAGRDWTLKAALIAFACLLALYLFKALFIDTDYLGPDNDDAMRLVIVRDLLAGQGWFDHMQYRLGIEPGTMMHWSRLIDLPIAFLIKAAAIFTGDQEKAEAFALFVWPVGLILPLTYFTGLAGYRLGGSMPAAIAVALAAIHAFLTHRFAPGAIDHHNVQMVLIAALAAALADSQFRAKSGLAAGAAAAGALAIGAETTPIIAAAAAAAALRWALLAERSARFAEVQGPSLGRGWIE